MASRYGSMKQVQGFGPAGETIMDYSIFDAIRAGFGKVIFIIRKEFVDSFKTIFEPKLKGRITTEYVYQELDFFTEEFEIPAHAFPSVAADSAWFWTKSRNSTKTYLAC